MAGHPGDPRRDVPTQYAGVRAQNAATVTAVEHTPDGIQRPAVGPNRLRELVAHTGKRGTAERFIQPIGMPLERRFAAVGTKVIATVGAADERPDGVGEIGGGPVVVGQRRTLGHRVQREVTADDYDPADRGIQSPEIRPVRHERIHDDAIVGQREARAKGHREAVAAIVRRRAKSEDAGKVDHVGERDAHVGERVSVEADPTPRRAIGGRNWWRRLRTGPPTKHREGNAGGGQPATQLSMPDGAPTHTPCATHRCSSRERRPPPGITPRAEENSRGGAGPLR